MSANGGTLTVSNWIVAGRGGGYFNYDGVINGSDYTLIDNAFNMQGASLAAQVSNQFASPTAQIGGTASIGKAIRR